MDVGRALLKFAAGYPLGEKGLDWLKIHIITLHGAKKKSVVYCSAILLLITRFIYSLRPVLAGLLCLPQKLGNFHNSCI